MPHAPFIIAAYGVAAVMLTWCAIGPLLAGRKLARQLRSKYQEADHAPNS